MFFYFRSRKAFSTEDIRHALSFLGKCSDEFCLWFFFSPKAFVMLFRFHESALTNDFGVLFFWPQKTIVTLFRFQKAQ